MMSQPQQDSPSVGESWREPKVVLFDMDGVLYDSMPNHGIAWQRAMKEFGIHFTLEDSYATEGARGVAPFVRRKSPIKIRNLVRMRPSEYMMLRHIISMKCLRLRCLMV